jgi:hypothetical protein
MADEQNLSVEEMLRRYQNAPSEQPSTEEMLRNYQAANRAEAAPEDVTAGMALRGVPVLGAYVPQAEAAIRAAAQPLTGVGAPRATWRERYEANLPLQQAQYAQAERESPVTSAALQMAGGTAALAPLAAAAPAAFGTVPAQGLIRSLGAGAGSSAAISAADALARGEDPYAAAKIGAGFGAAGTVAGRAIGRGLTPFQVSPERAQAIAELERRGVTGMTAGEKTGSWIRYPESSLYDVTGVGPGDLARRQYTRAALEQAGIDADKATPEVLEQAFKNWGARADQLAENVTLRGDQELGRDLGNAIKNYGDIVAEPNQAPAFKNYIQEIMDHIAANDGNLPGKTYQSLSSRIERTARNAPWETASALRDLKMALSDAMERSAAGTPHEGMWRQLNRQYRTMLMIQDAAGGPGAATAEGLLSPAQLRTAVGRKDYARGRGDLADLARWGQIAMTPLPQSGTGPRAYWTMAVPGGLGAMGWGAMTGDPNMMWGGLVPIAGPHVAARLLMSRPAQAYLGNRMLAAGFRPPPIGTGIAPIIVREFQ